MGIRGHIQTTQPEYQGACISSWKSDQYQSFLLDQGIEVYQQDGSGNWEIEITDGLRQLAKELLAGEHEAELDALFSDDDLKGGNAKHLGEFLQCGIDVGDEKHYDFICVDFF